MAEKGIFYGVGIGPGAPGLLTLDAVRLIMDSPVIAAPRTKSGEMLALDIAKRGLREYPAETEEDSFWAQKTILPLDFPMTKDKDVLDREHRRAAELVKAHLDEGRNVAMLNLGDVTIYATVQYIADLLKEDGYEVRLCPGVTSFCASAAALGLSLTEMDTPVTILPGSADTAMTAQSLERPGTKIIMKSARQLPEVLGLLHEKGLADTTSAAVNCGLANERLYGSLTDFEQDLRNDPESSSYFTTLIVKENGGTK